MSQALVNEPVFEYTGGNLCLDFTNTLSGRRARPRERLTSYQDLVAWGRQAGVLTDADALLLERIAAEHPRDATRMFAEAVALREALYRILSSVVEGAPPGQDELAFLNAALSRAMDRLRVARGAGGFGWAWATEEETLDRMLWPVIRSAADLLVSGEAQRVRRCASESCDWLFLDTSRNHSRRWCDMSGCGNRAKARRHYARAKAGRL
jgi:predicted RNA-binding Zn ribbon-like protein